MGLILAFLFGILVGIFCLSMRWALRLVGTLRIINSETEGAYVFLDANKEMSEIWKHKYVFLKVAGGGKPSRR